MGTITCSSYYLFTIAAAMVTLWLFCALDSGLLLIRKADSYTCSIELEANLLHDNSGFRLAAGNKGRFLYVFDIAGACSVTTCGNA